MKNKTVLIIDDEPNIVKSVKRTLANEGYSMFSASSAEEALELQRQQEFDLIISDNMMPGMSGIEFYEKTAGEHADTVRILLTGFADMDTAIRAVNSGCVYKFMLKPWDNEMLRITVKRALEQRELVLENRNLTSQLKVKDAILQKLERQYPGITKTPGDKIYKIDTNK